MPLSGDGTVAYVTKVGSGQLVRVDLAAAQAASDASGQATAVREVQAGAGVELHDTMLGRAALPIGAIADPAGGRVFVAISGADRIAVIDTATWTVSGWWETGREPDALGIVAP